jgi:hypothetical protein
MDARVDFDALDPAGHQKSRGPIWPTARGSLIWRHNRHGLARDGHSPPAFGGHDGRRRAGVEETCHRECRLRLSWTSAPGRAQCGGLYDVWRSRVNRNPGAIGILASCAGGARGSAGEHGGARRVRQRRGARRVRQRRGSAASSAAHASTAANVIGTCWARTRAERPAAQPRQVSFDRGEPSGRNGRRISGDRC